MKNISVIMIVAGLLAVGCAKDRNVDDWRRDKVNEVVAKIQAVSGSYRGATDSYAVTMDFQPDVQANGSKDAVAAEPQAGIQGRIMLQSAGETRILPFKGGFFDYTTNQFKSEVTVLQRNGTSGRMEISGAFSGERLSARIEAAGFPESGMAVELVRNGPSVDLGSLSSSRGEIGSDQEKPLEYYGIADFKHGDSAPMKLLIIAHPTTNQDRAFFERFVPVRFLDMTIVLNSGVTAEFSNAEYDPRTGSLLGHLQTPVHGSGDADGYDTSLSCQIRAGGNGWSCRYLNNVSGLLFTAEFQRTAR